MALIEKEINNIYLGEYIPPIPTWTLWEQTIIQNSTSGSSGVIASTNGKIIRPSYSFGGGNGNYTITTTTVNGSTIYIVKANSSHGNCDIGMSDSTYSELISHKKIKLIYDYFNIGANQSSYSNTIQFGNDEWLNDTASSSTVGVGTKFTGMSFSYSTGYAMEQIINTSDMSTITTITNLSNNTITTLNYTKAFYKNTNTSYQINGGGYVFVKLVDDQGGGPVVTGDVHIYVSD